MFCSDLFEEVSGVRGGGGGGWYLVVVVAMWNDPIQSSKSLVFSFDFVVGVDLEG